MPPSQCVSLSVLSSLSVDWIGSALPPQASFVIEQFGLPKVKTDADGIERWNGVSPLDRLEELKAREK